MNDFDIKVCELCRFYGYGIEYVEEMDFQDFNMLYEGMHRIQARELLRQFTAHDYPNVSDKNAKRRLHKSVYKIAFPENFKQRTVKTTDLELF